MAWGELRIDDSQVDPTGPGGMFRFHDQVVNLPTCGEVADNSSELTGVSVPSRDERKKDEPRQRNEFRSTIGWDASRRRLIGRRR